MNPYEQIRIEPNYHKTDWNEVLFMICSMCGAKTALHRHPSIKDINKVADEHIKEFHVEN